MSTKAEVLRYSSSCLNKANSNEPLFVLRANDPLAAQTVRLWAAMAERVHEDDKVQEALALASQMEAYYAVAAANTPQAEALA